MYHQFRVSSLGSYVCSPLGVSSRFHTGHPARTRQPRVSLVGVPWVMGSLKRVSSQCADTNDSIHPSLCSFECVLFHSYPVYVHQLKVSSRVHMGNPTHSLQSRVSLFGCTWDMCSLKRVSPQVHVYMFTVRGCPLGFIWVHLGTRSSGRTIRVFVLL